MNFVKKGSCFVRETLRRYADTETESCQKGVPFLDGALFHDAVFEPTETVFLLVVQQGEEFFVVHPDKTINFLSLLTVSGRPVGRTEIAVVKFFEYFHEDSF